MKADGRPTDLNTQNRAIQKPFNCTEAMEIFSDKKGLLKDGGDSTDTLRRPNNGHKEYEYNKTTGVITGKHSSV